MKNVTLFIFCLLVSLSQLTAQNDTRFNYQAAARNADGTVMSNTDATVRMTVRNATATGSILYRETHNVTTNQYGLFNLAIGGGTIVSGSMDNIDWGLGKRFLQVELRANGSTFQDLGATELLAVPYAAHAAYAENGPKGDAPAHEWNGTRIRFENPDGSWGPWIDLQGLQGNDGTGVNIVGSIPNEAACQIPIQVM